MSYALKFRPDSNISSYIIIDCETSVTAIGDAESTHNPGNEQIIIVYILNMESLVVCVKISNIYANPIFV